VGDALEFSEAAGNSSSSNDRTVAGAVGGVAEARDARDAVETKIGWSQR
jgi:hypothetical protein